VTTVAVHTAKPAARSSDANAMSRRRLTETVDLSPKEAT
jgi:hypothetical protein